MITEYDFELAYGANSWKRVGDTHPIDLYYGKDEKGRCAIEFVGEFKINKKINSSTVIEINHYNIKDGKKSIVFSLLDNGLLRPFCSFLDTMIDSTLHFRLSNQEAYLAVCNVYFTMQKMFRSNTDLLSEAEIKGLIGELLFLRDTLIPNIGISKAIGSWSGAEKTRKDFALDNEWHEIKTINFGKETVHISSIEQLDSQIEGNLIIYQVEKMAEEFDGIKLNSIIDSILNCIPSIHDKDVFLSKLREAKYAYDKKYDEFVYDLRAIDTYRVDSNFPRISRLSIPDAIAKVSFDLNIAQILPFKR